MTNLLRVFGTDGGVEVFSQFVGPFTDDKEITSWLKDNGFSKMKDSVAVREGRSFFHGKIIRFPVVDKVFVMRSLLRDPKEAQVNSLG